MLGTDVGRIVNDSANKAVPDVYKRQVLPAVVWNLFIFVKEPKRATAIRWTKYGSVIKTGNVLPISVV